MVFHLCGVVHAYGAIHVGQVQIAPVDGDEVAGLAQHGLCHRPCLQVADAACGDAFRARRLVHLVDGELWRGGEVELHVVRLAVGRRHLIRQIVDGCREQVEVVDEHRCREDHCQLNRTAGEGVVGACGQHAHGSLYGVLSGGRRQEHVLIKAEVDVGSARGVMTMCGDDVCTLLQTSLLGSRQAMRLALQPRLAGSNDAASVDEEFEDVVVRELYPQLLLQVVGCEVYAAPDIDIAVLRIPGVAAVGILVGCAPSSIFRCPRAVVEVGGRPACAGLTVVVDLRRPPALAGRHRCDGLQQIGALAAHEAIGLSVDAQQSVHRLLGVAPVTCGAVVEFVERRPEREIGVVDEQRHGRQSERRGLVRLEDVGRLCCCHACCGEQHESCHDEFRTFHIVVFVVLFEFRKLHFKGLKGLKGSERA